MILTEKTLEKNYIYQGKILNVRRDTALLPNGKTSIREIVEHGGGVGILPIDDDGYVTMVNQFRYPYMKEILEIPAGKLDSKEEGHLACGTRELLEETGLVAKEMIYLGEFYPSVGYTNEVIHLYLALGLTQDKTNLDDDEFLNSVKIHIDTLYKMVMNNELCDGKTIAALFKAKLYLEK